MKKGLFTGRWTSEEHSKFLQGISIPNYCWSEVSQLVGTRSTAQCRSHYQKLNADAKSKPKRKQNPVFKGKSQKHSKEIQCNSTEDSSSYIENLPADLKHNNTELTLKVPSMHFPAEDRQIPSDYSIISEFEFKEDNFELYNF